MSMCMHVYMNMDMGTHMVYMYLRTLPAPLPLSPILIRGVLCTEMMLMI